MKDYLDKIPESNKKMIGAVAPLVVMIILFIIVAKFGISKVVDLRQKIASAQKDETVLTQKLKLLETISDTLGTGSSVATAVIPESNPSLVVLSQLKILASTKGIFVSNIKAGAEGRDDTGLSKADITFDVRGPRPVVVDFLKGTSTLAPIIKITKFKMSENSGETLVSVNASCFWAPLPKTIPGITDSINDLTPAERTLLTEISKLKQPLFVDIPAGSGGKINPFE